MTLAFNSSAKVVRSSLSLSWSMTSPLRPTVVSLCPDSRSNCQHSSTSSFSVPFRLSLAERYHGKALTYKPSKLGTLSPFSKTTGSRTLTPFGLRCPSLQTCFQHSKMNRSCRTRNIHNIGPLLVDSTIWLFALDLTSPSLYLLWPVTCMLPLPDICLCSCACSAMSQAHYLTGFTTLFIAPLLLRPSLLALTPNVVDARKQGGPLPAS